MKKIDRGDVDISGVHCISVYYNTCREAEKCGRNNFLSDECHP